MSKVYSPARKAAYAESVRNKRARTMERRNNRALKLSARTQTA